MKKLGFLLSEQFDVAGFTILVEKEKGAQLIYCPYIINTFSKKTQDKADFILTIKKSCNIEKDPDDKQLYINDDFIIMDYGSETERLYIESNKSLSNWSLYTSYRDGQIDNWFDRIGDLFAWAMPNKNAVVIHGVLLEWKGKGIIITAASGTGKTTHARLWREYENALIINGDRVLIKEEDKQWYAYGIPWCGSSGECINRKVKIDAIVFLNRGDNNLVNKLLPLDAIGKMFPRIIAPKWHDIYSKKAVDITIRCIERVPLFDLYCLPDRQSVEVLKKALEINNIYE
ncbi:MAG: hypothetical protein ACLRT4_14555 [Thomasclavelia sp.]